ncbi:serpin family protein [Chitinophaga sp.]|uniref:serpin family protein n=1 Tax=Chitinophaga sp. TaxID=1869181 RepID=UPI0026119ABE|nr:serpin family protein [uncultured Chitinophaga sp.]
MRKPFLYPLLLLLAAGCHNNAGPGSGPDTTGFPAVKRLDSSMRTAFVPVPDHPGEPGDNIVYAASFALAWDELSRILGGDPESTEPLVRRLNASDIHEGALRKEAYRVNMQVQGDDLSVKASFYKSLPFSVAFDVWEEGMLFGKKQRVRAFGMKRYDYPQASQASVLYYKDDDHFVVSLVAGPENDEMLLAKGFAGGEQLSVMRSRVERAIAEGKKEMKDDRQAWKFVFNDEDELKIPMLKMNLAGDIRELISLPVVSRGQTLLIRTAEQQTLFALDEKGVIVESAAVVDAAAAVMDMPVPPPRKLMHFDKPFFIMIRENKAKHPYFIMKVANAECMVKEERK